MKRLANISSLLAWFCAMPLLPASGQTLTLSQGSVHQNSSDLTTGNSSRAQVSLDPHGSLLRVGSNTQARITADSVKIDRGVILVSSGGRGFNRQPVTVSTPLGNVNVRGTTLLSVAPDGQVKAANLEGSVRGALQGNPIQLAPGQMSLAAASGATTKVEINLSALAGSSALLGSGFPGLPAMKGVQAETHSQAAVLARHNKVTPPNPGNSPGNRAVESGSQPKGGHLGGLVAQILGGRNQQAPAVTGHTVSSGSVSGTTTAASTMRLTGTTNGAGSGSLVINGGGSLSLSKSGPSATLLASNPLSGSNTYAGSSDVTASRITIAPVVSSTGTSVNLTSGSIQFGGTTVTNTVASGTLLINGSAQTGQSTSGVLGGSGTVPGTLTVTGGTLSAGTSQTQSGSGSLTLNGSAQTMQFNGATWLVDVTRREQTSGTDNVNLISNGVSLNNVLPVNGQYRFAQYTSGSVDFTGSNVTTITLPGGGTAFQIEYGNTAPLVLTTTTGTTTTTTTTTSTPP